VDHQIQHHGNVVAAPRPGALAPAGDFQRYFGQVEQAGAGENEAFLVADGKQAADPALLVLAVRGLESGPRTLQMAIGELVLYVAVTAALTVWLERSLLREAIGYLRRPRPRTDPLPVGA